MPVLQGFIGSAYKPQGGLLDTQELVNYYLERAESPNARGPQQLLPCPGFEVFCTFPGSPIRGIFAQNSRTFVVAGSRLYEVSRLGVITERAMTALATPSAPTVTPAPLADPLDTPEAPVVTHGGTLGSTTYGYQIVAVNSRGETDASVEGTSDYGHAVLSATNFNLVTWAPVTGATRYKVYRTTGGGSVPVLIATVPANTLLYMDIGTAGTAETPPSTNSSGGAAGSTTYGYKVTATLGLGETAASDEGVTITGQATLSAEDYNTVSWPEVPNAHGYNIYRTTGGVSAPRLIGSVTGDTLEFRDVGEEGESLTPPTATTTGTASIADDGAPVAIYSSGDAGQQLLIVGGGSAFCFSLEHNTLAEVVDGASSGGYIGTYFVVLDAATSTLKVSESLDGFTWDASQVYQRQTAGDSFLSMAVTSNEIWLLGSETTEVWEQTTDDETRFIPKSFVFIEHGIIAPGSLVRIADSLMWVAQNKDGAGYVLRTSQGYGVVRVSTHQIDRQLKGLASLADAIAWTYLEEGHHFYVLTFPSDNVTWVYDALTNEWHQRGYWDPDQMAFSAYRPVCHAFAFGGLGFGMHLVGDGQSGVVAKMSVDYGTDIDGSVIRRVRQAPMLSTPGKDLIFLDELKIDVQTGLGVSSGQGSDPTMMLQVSRDEGKTWGHEHWRSAGPQGKYGRRVRWTKLGSGRGIVVRLVVSDPIPWRLIGAAWEGEAVAA